MFYCSSIEGPLCPHYWGTNDSTSQCCVAKTTVIALEWKKQNQNNVLVMLKSIHSGIKSYDACGSHACVCHYCHCLMGFVVHQCWRAGVWLPSSIALNICGSIGCLLCCTSIWQFLVSFFHMHPGCTFFACAWIYTHLQLCTATGSMGGTCDLWVRSLREFLIPICSSAE